jgi:L-asparaginase II
MERLVAAVVANPFMIAGTGRLDTQLLETGRGGVVAKVGAEGVYCAALPAAAVGVALKVEDGDNRSVGPALLALLDQVAPGLATAPAGAREPSITNSRGEVVGRLVPRINLTRP